MLSLSNQKQEHHFTLIELKSQWLSRLDLRQICELQRLAKQWFFKYFLTGQCYQVIHLISQLS